MFGTRQLSLTLAFSLYAFVGIASQSTTYTPTPVRAGTPLAAGAGAAPWLYGDRSEGQVVLTLDWGQLPQGTKTHQFKESRVDENVSVLVKVIRFNFVHYALQFAVEEQQVESYVALDKLWKQLVGFTGAAFAASQGERTAFEDKLVEWLSSIRETEEDLKAFLNDARYKTIGLTESQANEMRDKAERMGAAKEDLLKLHFDALQLMNGGTLEDIGWYDKILPQHEALLARIDAFSQGAALSINGRTWVVGKKKAGTLVTATFTPKAVDGSEQEPFRLEYFVHSKLPVLFHVGYAYSDFSQVEFEKIRALNGQDVFALVRGDKGTDAFTAFLSFEIWSWRWKNHSFGTLATLGTDLTSPGDKVYVGGSLRLFERFLISGGVSTRVDAEGTDPFIEDLGDSVGARELFLVMSSKRDWTGFVAVTFNVF